MSAARGDIRRIWAPGLCLALLLFCEARELSFHELSGRMALLYADASIAPDRARIDGSGFAFDRRFGVFLRDVAAIVPGDQPVTLDAPHDDPRYAFAAAYVLAPRPVAIGEENPAARVAAFYRPGPFQAPPGALRLRYGFVLRLR